MSFLDAWKDRGEQDVWDNLNELADWADTWAYENGIDYGDYDDYGIDDLAIDLEAAGVDTKVKAREYMRQIAN